MREQVTDLHKTVHDLRRAATDDDDKVIELTTKVCKKTSLLHKYLYVCRKYRVHKSLAGNFERRAERIAEDGGRITHKNQDNGNKSRIGLESDATGIGRRQKEGDLPHKSV